jgi:CheY-like chemotaxis protein
MGQPGEVPDRGLAGEVSEGERRHHGSAAGRDWPLRRYLVGLVVLFVATAAAGVVYGWVTADRDARTAAAHDARFGAHLAATEVGGSSRRSGTVWRILSAANGLEALDTVANHQGHIDLLLTDVVMPHMPGHELAEHLHRTHPTLPVIYLSGYAEPILTTHKTLPAGVTLLNKPVPEHRLLTAIRDTLDHPPDHD